MEEGERCKQLVILAVNGVNGLSSTGTECEGGRKGKCNVSHRNNAFVNCNVGAKVRKIYEQTKVVKKKVDDRTATQCSFSCKKS